MNHKQNYTPVRFSHLTSYASIGAIVRDVNDMLMTVTDTRYWTDKSNNITAEIIPYVCRVRKALEIDKELRMPPTAKELENGEIDGDYLPAVLFPTFAVCRRCGLLHPNPWRNQQKLHSDEVTCESCDSQLDQVTWCAISSKGHLEDVPWHDICHKGSEKKCEENYSSAYLKLSSNSNGRKIVICTICASRQIYGDIKTPNKSNEKRWIHLSKYQPWNWAGAPKLEDDDVVEILEVNNAGVYLPERVNALVIPPESRRNKNEIVDQLLSNSKLCREIEKISSKHRLRRKGKIKEVATDYRCSVDDVENALRQLEVERDCSNLGPLTDVNLFEDEYKAFLTPIDGVRESEDFVPDHKTEQWHNVGNKMKGDLFHISKLVDSLVIAKRLREIQIFKGFYRVSDDEKKNLVPPDVTGKSDWLPAIELFGEGLFFTIDEDLLSRWESIEAVQNRFEEINERYMKPEVTINLEFDLTPRFLLLHTLSHLLIRELETTAGYPAASLKERIYCSSKMSGILIYTTVADIVGSLGGIIESAEPKEFLSLLDGVFKHAQWCSLDPVCSEHEGQGPGWLNRAACHACALVPEPSCGYSNVFLDRILIKGSEELGIPNLLKFVEGVLHGKD